MAGGVNYIPGEFGKPQEYCHPHHRIPTDLEPAFVIGKDETCCPPTGDPCECVTSGDIEKWNFVYDNFSALADIDVSAINNFVDDVSALNSSADSWNSAFETVSSNSANWNAVDDLKASAEDHEERISALESFSAETEDKIGQIDDALDSLHFDNDITDPNHSISGDGSISSPFGVNNYAALKNSNDNYEELNRHIVKFSADGSNNALYEFDGAAYNVARIDNRLSGIDQTNATQNSNIERNYELITEVANRQKGKQDKLDFSYNNSGYIVAINNSALVGEMGGLTGDLQGALDQVYENSANWSEVSAKVDASAFDTTISAMDEKVDTKLDASAFSDVSGTFYTTDNPSAFIDNAVDDLVNYYTKTETYSQTEINEMLANFGGFEVVELTTGANPHPDVSDPSTKIIYLTKDSSSSATDPYTEWIYTESDGWEIIGETTVDLSDYQPISAMSAYYLKTETSAAQEITDALALKQNVLTAGTDLSISADVISVDTNGIASGAYSFVEGMNTFAGDTADHVEGIGGRAEQGGCTHIEGFQYHGYASYGPASNFAGLNVVKFSNTSTIAMPHDSSGTLSVSLYDLVKALKDCFKVSCEMGDSGNYHYTDSGSFYEPLLYNIVDVSLDGDLIAVTLDGNFPSSISSGGYIKLLGPTYINSITGNGGTLSSGDVLKTYEISYIGFGGNTLDTIRTDNCVLYISVSYALDGGDTVKIYRILKLEDIQYDSNTDKYLFTTEESIVIPEILGGGYNISVYRVNPPSNGGNHIEGMDNAASGSFNHVEGIGNYVAGGIGSHAEGITNIAKNTSHVEGCSTSALDQYSHAEGYQTSAASYGNYNYDYAVHAEGYQTSAKGRGSHAEGAKTIAVATGGQCHAEGWMTQAIANHAHAEGEETTASNNNAHAEGTVTKAAGWGSHAEGQGTSAIGMYAHAEGCYTSGQGEKSHVEGERTSANGSCAHSEGYFTLANASYSHAEGYYTSASGAASHAEGSGVSAVGDNSHAEGYSTYATGYASHAEGCATKSYGTQSHAEGYGTSASGYASHAEGYSTYASGSYSHTEGYQTSAIDYAHAEGQNTLANGYQSHAEGYSTVANGTYSHSEGYSTVAHTLATHAEGYSTTAAGQYSHAEGQTTIANNMASHAEGLSTTAAGNNSHTEGQLTLASNTAAHAEGTWTTAAGEAAHAEGIQTSAYGTASHAAGLGTSAYSNYMTVIGKYNATNDAAFVVGNGTSTAAANRSDALVVDWNGKASATVLATSGISDVEAAISGINAVPDSTTADNGKVLTVSSNGTPVWVSGGGGPVMQFSASYDSATETFSIDFSNGGN